MAKHVKKYHLSFVQLTALSWNQGTISVPSLRGLGEANVTWNAHSSFVEQQFFLDSEKEQAASVSSMGYAGVGRRQDPTILTIGESPVSSKSQ